MRNKTHKITSLTIIASLLFCGALFSQPQIARDNFEGNSTIFTWFGDNCILDTSFNNPYPLGINSSSKVLKYADVGGQYANVRFDTKFNLNLSVSSQFSLKLYVPSSGITGNENNQISLKLQNGFLASPWETQCEIIKPIVLNQWQTITFDFATDPFINLNPSSPNPIDRSDFNRVLIQINGENNNSNVLAFVDDFLYISAFSASSEFNNLVWSDEFDSNGAVNTSNWFYQTQLPNGSGWYNGELQHYTNQQSNSFVSNGILNIVAKKETFTDQGQTKQFTSARLNSKFAFKYGRVEIRAKLPTGAGTWPAIWMLGKSINEPGGYWAPTNGSTNWPACGEIDIMEHWGTNQNVISSAIHFPINGNLNVGQYVTNAQYKAGVSSDFHIYAVEWNEQKIVFSVDGINHLTYNPSVKNQYTWPFDAEQYILLNVAIEPSVSNSFVQSAMEVDYVRVYQKNCSPTTSTFTVNACNSYTWADKGNKVYTANNNTDTIHLINAGGCDSLVTLNLTINNATSSSTTQVACGSYVWNGVTYTSSGTHTKTFTNSKGCDSIATLNLTINTATSSTNNVNVCGNQLPYSWNGTNYNAAGTYTKTLTNAKGCDSVATLVLTTGSPVTPTITIHTASAAVCNGNSVTFNAGSTNGGNLPVYQWKKNGNNLTTGTSITFAPNTLATGDIISCVLTANNPCQTTNTAISNSITLEVKPSPIIGSSTGFTACSLGSTIGIYNTNTQGGGIWSSNNTAVATVTTASNGGTGLVVPKGNGFAILTYTKASTNGCVSTASANVIVAVQAAPSAITGVNSICKGNTTQLSSTTAGGVWSISPSTYASINSTGFVTSTNVGVANAKYTVTNANGCSANTTYTVTVNAFPLTPTIAYQAGTANPQSGAGGAFCSNRTFTVIGSPSGGIWSKTGVITVTSPGGLVTTGSIAGAGTITYIYTNSNGCSSSRTIAGNVVICAARGVNGASSEQLVASSEFTIYPNPAKSFISLNVNTLMGTGSIVVTDLYGKQVKMQSLSIGTNTIDIASFAKGIYFVSTITSEGKTTKKLVVE